MQALKLMMRLLLLLPILLSACAGLHQASFDKAFASALLHNNTQGIFANCNAANANYPLNGSPPIYYAASYGNDEAIDLLYNYGASLQSRGANGKSLAYAAAANGHADTAGTLVKLGAGTSSDLSSGAVAFRRKQAAEAEARKLQAAALAWLAKAMFSGGGGGESCVMCGASGPLSSGRCPRCYAAAGGR